MAIRCPPRILQLGGSDRVPYGCSLDFSYLFKVLQYLSALKDRITYGFWGGGSVVNIWKHFEEFRVESLV